MAVVLDDQHGGLDEVEVVTIPQIGLDDPPAADQLAIHRCRHGAGSASSLGNRTRLQAATVSVNIQPARSRPRWRVSARPAVVLIQPKLSSIRLRMHWLTA